MNILLHCLISLGWFRLRDLPDPYDPLDPVPRTVAGDQPRQRPRNEHVEKLEKYQEDNIYHHAEVGRISTEMVRPSVGGAKWGGYDVAKLRIAGLARAVQSRLYLHSCSHKYCLQNRRTHFYIS